MTNELEIGVMGAGAIGCFIGGMLASRGARVVFVGRTRTRDELKASGLALSDLEGNAARVDADKLVFATDTAALARCGVVLCCVKSAQTAGAADDLARVLDSRALVVSMQNGVRNADALREKLGDTRVLGGVVGFNVVWSEGGALRRTTSGPLVIERASDPRIAVLARALGECGFQVELAKDVRGKQWSKLMMNVNNAVSALTDAPTRELVFRKELRRILAALVSESLAVMRRAGVRPARLGPIPVGLFPFVLSLPTPVLRVALRAQLKIDPEARSSMWEDLSRGRLTEVDWLNGEIVRLAESCGTDAPLNRRIVEIVHAAEREGRGSPKLSPEALWARLTV